MKHGWNAKPFGDKGRSHFDEGGHSGCWSAGLQLAAYWGRSGARAGQASAVAHAACAPSAVADRRQSARRQSAAGGKRRVALGRKGAGPHCSAGRGRVCHRMAVRRLGSSPVEGAAAGARDEGGLDRAAAAGPPSDPTWRRGWRRLLPRGAAGLGGWCARQLLQVVCSVSRGQGRGLSSYRDFWLLERLREQPESRRLPPQACPTIVLPQQPAANEGGSTRHILARPWCKACGGLGLQVRLRRERRLCKSGAGRQCPSERRPIG